MFGLLDGYLKIDISCSPVSAITHPPLDNFPKRFLNLLRSSAGLHRLHPALVVLCLIQPQILT